MRLFTEREIKVVAVVVGASALLSVLITVAVMTQRRGRPPQGAAPAPPEIVLDVSDFLIPEEVQSVETPEWFSFRVPMTRWSREQVERYWIDPREIGLDALSRRSDEAVARSFEAVP